MGFFGKKKQNTLNVGNIRKYDEEKVLSLEERTFPSFKIASLPNWEGAKYSGGIRLSWIKFHIKKLSESSKVIVVTRKCRKNKVSIVWRSNKLVFLQDGFTSFPESNINKEEKVGCDQQEPPRKRPRARRWRHRGSQKDWEVHYLSFWGNWWKGNKKDLPRN